MKFKDLKVGQKFRMPNWQSGTVDEKIDPRKNNGRTHREVTLGTSGVRGSWVKPDDEVIPLS